MDRQTFLNAVRQNADRITSYRDGADGAGGSSDCIGLVIGALKLVGEPWTGIHGTNYTVRHQLAAGRHIASAADLLPGDLVFKFREKGEKGYALPARYDAHPDTRDYYHVGVVMNTAPLEILHCSLGGMHRDTAIGAWRYAGHLPQVFDAAPVLRTAFVISPNGKGVNLRAAPSLSAEKLSLIPVATRVRVLEEASEEWCKVMAQGRIGYIMRTYLSPEDLVTLSLPRDAAQSLLQALKSSLDA